MKYRFVLTYQSNDIGTEQTRTCFPLHSDDLVVSIDRESDEWYYTRKLDGNLVFTGGDYDWIMDDNTCPFDGTFTLDVKESHDNGVNWYDYFTGIFSRASMEIDEDNHTATLNGLSEGVADLIKNGKSDEYDLMKLIPDSQAKEVQGQVPPALALVDFRSTEIDKSDIFCGGAGTAGGYKSGVETGWDQYQMVTNTIRWLFVGIYAEAKVEMKDGYTDGNGTYCGILQYQPVTPAGTQQTYTAPCGTLYKNDGNADHRMDLMVSGAVGQLQVLAHLSHDDSPEPTWVLRDRVNTLYYSPASIESEGSSFYHYKKITIYYHYIRASLLTYAIQYSALGLSTTNILDTGDYYRGMYMFNNDDGGLEVAVTGRTVEQPNGHRMVPGSDEYGGLPQYFAPPDDSGDWIPLAEDNWNFASMWYQITPSVDNGLADPAKIGYFSWTRCWTVGTCLQALLKRITSDKVVFAETTDYSRFLYSTPNPVEGGEPFQWLVTQKSNVMRPSTGGAGASRCPVRLEWFLELLRNAFNCYYWLEKRNDGRYDFKIEHVEYFRRGGAYQSELAALLDLTALKPTRNFLRNGQPAKHYADQTNKYSFNLDNMVEKYTFSWQGDGGGDDFKGNPMFFRAGWIEKGTSEDHQVDNIFADLGWLMLNAGTATESSKNYDGLFIFGGYRPFDTSLWNENAAASAQLLPDPMFLNILLSFTAPEGHTITYEHYNTQTGVVRTVETYTGTGEPQVINITFSQGYENTIPRINFGATYRNVIIHRIQTDSGNVYRVPNVANLLRANNHIQNGVLAWPWLQNEYLHYDIPAAKWALNTEDPNDAATVWNTNGTIKLVKKQTIGVAPITDAATEQRILGIMGVRTGLGVGIVDSAKINLASRNGELTLIYDINPQNN